jgi:hypothetical protein
VAGAFNEKVGMMEKPLLLIPTEPEKVEMLCVLSVCWAELPMLRMLSIYYNKIVPNARTAIRALGTIIQ